MSQEPCLHCARRTLLVELFLDFGFVLAAGQHLRVVCRVLDRHRHGRGAAVVGVAHDHLVRRHGLDQRDAIVDHELPADGDADGTDQQPATGVQAKGGSRDIAIRRRGQEEVIYVDFGLEVITDHDSDPGEPPQRNLLLVMSDITSRKCLENELHRLAYVDLLTDLLHLARLEGLDACMIGQTAQIHFVVEIEKARTP